VPQSIPNPVTLPHTVGDAQDRSASDPTGTAHPSKGTKALAGAESPSLPRILYDRRQMPIYVVDLRETAYGRFVRRRSVILIGAVA
jgi:hypothetical protein